MKKCICIFGPTASGKTSLAIKIANEYNGVIISADSMQIYKELNIGTAKPSKTELSMADFRMTDFLPLENKYSVYDFKIAAENEIESILSSGKLPILCGGTGLYFDAILNNTDFGEFDIKEEIRNDLQSRSENMAELLSELKKIDPVTAEKLHEKDKKRIIRALEVYYSTGKTLTQYKEESHNIPPKYSFLNLRLSFNDRALLYERIEKRVDQMIKDGLIEETKYLISKNFEQTLTASQAIGYKEIISYLDNEISLDDAISLLKQHTRNYAKRQITWFKRYDAYDIFMDGSIDPFSQIKEYINQFLGY